MGWESPSHWVIIAIVVVVLFGYKKLPEMSRSVGRSLRIFKTEMKGMGEDDTNRDKAAEGEAVVPPVPPVVAAPVATTSAAPTAAVPPAATAPVVSTPVVAPPVVSTPAAPAVPPTAVPTVAPTQPEPAAEAPREVPQQQARS